MPNYKYPEQIEDYDLIPAHMVFRWFERAKVSDSFPSDNVYLYMPESASLPSTVEWEQQAMGKAGKIISEAAKNYRNGGGVGGFMNSLTGEVGGAAGQSLINGAGTVAMKALNSDLTGEQAQSLATKQIENPFLTMLFKGINLRSFEYQFTFYPHKEADCDRIDQIIKLFRKKSLPALAAGGGALSFPEECEIEYFWEGKPNKWMHKFKRCVCTKVDVDYTASGQWSVMRNGFPAEIKMVLGFTELEIVTSKDIKFASDGDSY